MREMGFDYFSIGRPQLYGDIRPFRACHQQERRRVIAPPHDDLARLQDELYARCSEKNIARVDLNRSGAGRRGTLRCERANIFATGLG